MLNLSQLLQNRLLGQLQQKNPQAYQMISQAKASGKSPEQLIDELSKNGTFTQSQLEQAKAQAQSMLNNTNNQNTAGTPIGKINPLRR